ncbi:MAG: PaaI family thioesterase [Acidimicrobiia bacterium]
MALTEQEQQERRSAMREIMLATPYIAGLGVVAEQWDADGVRLRLPFDPRLTNDGHVLHGGAVASLVDTAGASAVFAGHDFDKGARAATVSMTVNFTGAGRDTDLIANARCVRRGRDLSFAEIDVLGPDGRLVATGSLVYRIV